MLDIGWSEMAIVAVVALFVIGPRELPRMLRTFGRYAAKVRGMAREFQDGIDEAVREAELDEVRKQIESAGKIDIGKTIEDTVDPERRIGKAMDFRDVGKPAPDGSSGPNGPNGPNGKDGPDGKQAKPTAAPAPAGAEAEAAPAEPGAGETRADPPPETRPAPGRAGGMAASIAAAAPPRRPEPPRREAAEAEPSPADA